jgi:hypothetical protein
MWEEETHVMISIIIAPIPLLLAESYRYLRFSVSRGLGPNY